MDRWIANRFENVFIFQSISNNLQYITYQRAVYNIYHLISKSTNHESEFEVEQVPGELVSLTRWRQAVEQLEWIANTKG